MSTTASSARIAGGSRRVLRRTVRPLSRRASSSRTESGGGVAGDLRLEFRERGERSFGTNEAREGDGKRFGDSENPCFYTFDPRSRELKLLCEADESLGYGMLTDVEYGSARFTCSDGVSPSRSPSSGRALR